MIIKRGTETLYIYIYTYLIRSSLMFAQGCDITCPITIDEISGKYLNPFLLKLLNGVHL